MDIKVNKVRQKLVHKPSPELLTNWQVLMAIEVVDKWIHEGDVRESIPNVMEQLDVSPEKSTNVLLDELNLAIERTKNTTISPETYRTEIEEYFFNEIMTKLQDIGHNLRVNSREIFLEAISIDCQQASPKKLWEFLKDLSIKILAQKNKFEIEKSNYLKQEASSSRAFFSLANQLNDYQPNSKNHRAIIESMWKANKICFESKFQVELYTIYSQALNNVAQECHSIHDSTVNSIKTLNTIKRSLRRKCTINILSVPIFTHLKRIDAHRQRHMLEVWINQSINYWGNAAVSWQQIEAKLLLNVEPLALSFYREFQHHFIEYTTTTENFNKDFRNF